LPRAATRKSWSSTFRDPARTTDSPDTNGKIGSMNNVTIMGGMLMVRAFGPGRIAIDPERG
jgi:uncharacterized membrane protein YphA (DoxX/SURF4 family)